MKKQPKLTPWFDGNVKPLRRGVYERLSLSGTPVYAQWTGRRWKCRHHSVMGAAKMRFVSVYTALRWRGLAKEPKS